ncbi:MAG TPA: ABC transporter permease [Candidatus Polarisedimenticolia bacterium]|nr:ABC transporter permease [Candidatus Polarisedimenticolia bacterium]
MATLLQDFRYGFRMLLKSPGITAIAILTLGLGIGANTAIFSIVNAVLLRPLPYPEPERLVRVHGNNLPLNLASSPVSPLDMADFRRDSRTFENLASFSHSTAVLTGRGEPRSLVVSSASFGLMDLLGARLERGRFFLPDEEKEGSERVIVLSHDFWQSEFGADPGAIGQMLTLAGIPRRVVGVLPRGFRSPVPGPQGEPDIWRPLLLPSDPGARGGHWTWCVGRLKPGVTLRQAQADLDSLAQNIERTYPATSTGWRTRIVSLGEDRVGDVRGGLLALSGAVSLVLLIACANVASLLLGRASLREREMAIRRALGAGPWRISRQVLTECVLLSVAGGAFGALLASWMKDLVLTTAASSLPSWAEIRLDGRVLLFTLAISVLTGLVFGFGPALHGLGADLGRSLKEGGSQAGAGRERARFRRGLVAIQVALSVILLAGAVLMLQSLWRLLSVDTGFRAEKVVTLPIALPPARYTEAAQINSFYRGLLDRVSALPGLRAEGLINILPLSGGYSGDSFLIDEHPAVAPGQEPSAEHRAVSEGYFATLGIPLLRGRLISGRDDGRAPPVAVINDAMARAFFPAEDPLGKHIKYNEVSREIVGIVGDVRHFSLAEEPRPEYYFPFAQEALTEYTLVVRGPRDPASLGPPLKRVIRELDRDLAVGHLRPLDELVDRSVAQPRFRAILLGCFAALALLLSAVGIYGVLSSAVSQRTREIGVRMALGARRRDVVGMVVGEGMKLVGIGMGAGLLGSLGLNRWLSGFLYQVSANNPFTLAGVSILLGCVALLACGLPAWRAARVEPMSALRYE